MTSKVSYSYRNRPTLLQRNTIYVAATPTIARIFTDFLLCLKKSVYVSMGQSRRVEMVTKRTIHILFCISFLAIAVNCEGRSFDKG